MRVFSGVESLMYGYHSQKLKIKFMARGVPLASVWLNLLVLMQVKNIPEPHGRTL
jgi:hypothetical protein